MKYKWILSLVAIFIISTLVAVPLFANIQIQLKSVTIDNVYYSVGQNLITGKPMLQPSFNIRWTDPDEWAPDSVPADIHNPDYYEAYILNKTTGADAGIVIRENDPRYFTKLLKAQENMQLETGSLYQITVQPQHYHYDPNTDTFALANVVSVPTKNYAITDVDVSMDASKDSITVTWDDVGLPEIDYRIVYALGDYSGQNKDTVISNKEGEILGLKLGREGVVSSYDEFSKRNKLSYTLKQGIYPGQVYTLFVEPVLDYYQGRPVARNINYPYLYTTSTNIPLNVYEDGDYLRLEWDIPPTFKVGKDQSSYELVEAKLVEYIDDQGRNVVIFDEKAANMEYYKVAKPSRQVEYQLELRYEAVGDVGKAPITPKSDRVGYVPIDLQIQPTKPHIPLPLSQGILTNLQNQYTFEEVKTILQDNYFVKQYTYNSNLSELMGKRVTFTVQKSLKAIDFVWSSFRRKDVDPTSLTFGQFVTDKNTYYDIYVTNKLEDLAVAIPVAEDLRFDLVDVNNVITDGGTTILGYKEVISQYYDARFTELQNIIPNQIYYIKVVAKKKWANIVKKSEPAITTIYYDYKGDVFSPPVITKPPLKIRDNENTTKSVTIEWKEQWWEFIQADAVPPSKLAEWQHQIWIGPDGTAYTEATDGTDYFGVFEKESEGQRLQNYLTSVGVSPASILTRQVNLGRDEFGVSDVKYKFYRVPYAEVQAAINLRKITTPTYSFANYYTELIKADQDGTKIIPWVGINANEDPAKPGTLVYREGGLTPNTVYLFLIYPYRDLFGSEVVYAHYPTPLIVATEPESSVITPDPTVPNLYVSRYSATDATVTWKYNTDFTYELVYSLKDDVTKGEKVEIVLPTSTLDPLYPKNGKYYEVNIKDLFPNTPYYFYLRAVKPSDKKTSAWSNTASVITSDIDLPQPPRGLGIASLAKMKQYNFTRAVDYNTISIEWVKDTNDIVRPTNPKLTIEYSYIVEMADNPLFIDPIYVESTDKAPVAPSTVAILEKSLIKYNELIQNRNYYFRAKTRVTYKGVLPEQFIVRESINYTTTLKIQTSRNNNEYDGLINGELIVLPATDYEIKVDEKNAKVTYRLRSDAEGDYGTDQRLISNFIKQNTYAYTIDLSAQMKDNYKAEIQIPNSIVQALDTYKVDLNIITPNLEMNIPYNSFKTAISKQQNQLNVQPKMIITISPYESFYLAERMPSLALLPLGTTQVVTVAIQSDKKTDQIVNADKKLEISLSTNNRYDAYGKTLSAFEKSPVTNKWVKVQGKYSVENAAMQIETATLGTYGVYSGKALATTTVKPHWADSYKKTMESTYQINGPVYNPSAVVNQQSLYQIAQAMVNDQSIVDMNAAITDLSKNELQMGGLMPQNYVLNKSVTREEAFNVFARLEELTNNKYQTIIPADYKMLPSGVSAQYQNGIVKAIKNGLVSDIKQIRPKDKLTYAELYTLWYKLTH